MNAGKAFFDTNVLLYVYSRADPKKRALAKKLFQGHARSGNLLLSTQVIQEFYAAGSRKMGLPRVELQEAVSALLDLPLVTIAGAHILSAIQLEELYQISFWDALIVASAALGGADILYTEDLSDGQQYGAVMVWNPFKAT